MSQRHILVLNTKTHFSFKHLQSRRRTAVISMCRARAEEQLSTTAVSCSPPSPTAIIAGGIVGTIVGLMGVWIVGLIRGWTVGWIVGLIRGWIVGWIVGLIEG